MERTLFTAITQKEKKYLLIIAIALFFCFNLFRILADFMLDHNVPFLITYCIAIFIHNIIPLILIIYGFRKASPLLSFCIVFFIACPVTMLMDLLVFATEPLALLSTPAYTEGQIIFGVLLGFVAYGTSLLDHRKNAAVIILIISIMLFFFYIRDAIFPLIGTNPGFI